MKLEEWVGGTKYTSTVLHKVWDNGLFVVNQPKKEFWKLKSVYPL